MIKLTRQQEFEQKAFKMIRGSADLYFSTEDDVKFVRKRLKENGIELVGLGDKKSDDRVVERTDARGKLRSVYYWDSDGI
ncbi:hypothetical protein NA56DRAFT_567186 [Hyaloscypha hepaticicola]|uniref:Uncharacterized protein n=1 Tax=Hyaloscypha hepaticicola TaxID=2082293 RepID=A0A2J6QDG3_9HELO|nr:hypothetical protein NA56DRAFT_567186 [Hyaloscypha hepaticicola]